jgi:prevent-host-death family protein
MDSYNIADVKARLSELVERAEAGEEIEIKRRGEPVAKIVPIAKAKKGINLPELRAMRERQKARLLAEGKEPWDEPVNFVQWLRQTEQI